MKVNLQMNPRAQRTLRGNRPTSPMPRVRNSADHLAWLAGHLTPRDRWLARMLFEHKVLTTHQIIDLAYPSRRAANLRLLNLYKWGVVHRFQPHSDLGSHPMHYVLDTAGATLLAHEEGIEPSTLNYKRDREIGRAHSLQLAHLVGCNGLFTSLVRCSRQPDATGTLTAWWSATRCGRHWGDIVTPDGYGRWHEAGRDIEWFMEFDFGTEQLSRLANKITRYERLATTTGITTPLLMWFPSPQREATARRILLETQQGLERPDRVLVATTNTTAASDPLDSTEPRWLRVSPTQTAGRVALADLPTLWPHIPAPAQLQADAGHLDTRKPDLAPPRPTPPPVLEYRKRAA
jgi:protein involved in plasmid replication-relaxation